MNITFKQGAFLSIIIGLSIFLFFFHFSILDPSNVDWIFKNTGDLLQHHLGSVAFRYDNWHFPITKTTEINYPEGISIVYTDSNLFLSMIAKLFKSVFPPEYQFWGIWYLFCWILQSFFAYLLVYTLSKDVKYSLLAAILFSLLPTIYYRIGHSNLIAHWLILAAIFVFIKKDYSEIKKFIIFWVLLFFSATIHAYLLFMVMIIFGVWAINQLVIELKNKNVNYKNLLINIGFGIAFILWMWILGYFYNQPKHNNLLGFGSYSMNINAILNPFGKQWSIFFPTLQASKNQYEGFQFLGGGIILLFLTFNITYFINEKFYNSKIIIYFTVIYTILVFNLFYFIGDIMRHEHFEIIDTIILFFWIVNLTLLIHYIRNNESTNKKLLIAAIICLVIALSHDITIGKATILKIEISEEMGSFLQFIRSSGRFYWVTNSIFMLFLFNYFHKKNWGKPILKYLFLTVFIIIQLIDLHKIDMSLGVKRSYQASTQTLFTQLLKSTNKLKFINSFEINLAKEAILEHKKINDFYMAHDRGVLSKKRYEKDIMDFNNGIYQDDVLYLLKDFGQLAKNKKHILYPINDSVFTINTIKNSSNNIVFFHDSISFKELNKQINTNEIVIFTASIQSKEVTHLPTNFISNFDNEFSCHLNELSKNKGYLAIFHNGLLVTEKIGFANDIKYNNVLDSYKIEIKPCKNKEENSIKILLNGINYSLQKSGINGVLIKNKNTPIHAFYFDTFEKTKKED